MNEALRLMLETDRPTPESAADGSWQEGFDLTQAEARNEFAALESDLATAKQEIERLTRERDNLVVDLTHMVGWRDIAVAAEEEQERLRALNGEWFTDKTIAIDRAEAAEAEVERLTAERAAISAEGNWQWDGESGFVRVSPGNRQDLPGDDAAWLLNAQRDQIVSLTAEPYCACYRRFLDSGGNYPAYLSCDCATSEEQERCDCPFCETVVRFAPLTAELQAARDTHA